jgi:hypothetical protein
MDTILGLIVFIVFVVVYITPGMIATSRGLKSDGWVWDINIFLGWTFIGWIVALAMAFGGNTKTK